MAERNPKLVWTIKPGEYSLVFVTVNASGQVDDFTVDYSLSF